MKPKAIFTTLISMLLLLCCQHQIACAQRKTEHVILITLDGLRWQELFTGADKGLLEKKHYVTDHTLAQTFWDENIDARRKKLMPFFWNEIATQGQLYGNRHMGSKVNCANPHWFSYPGYSEMLVGFVDRRIHSNRAIQNPNNTVFNFVAAQPAYKNKVAAFATWEVISAVLGSNKKDMVLNTGHDVATGDISENEMALNQLQAVLKNPHGPRYDTLTFAYAFEYLKRAQPDLLFISFDETDEHGHGGRYDQYLAAAHRTDQLIQTLWQWIQNNDVYKNKTTLLITTDHGRGNGKRSWKNHGCLFFGSSEIWFAALGPDTPAVGEVKTNNRYYQKQIAATIGAFLGLHYGNVRPTGHVIDAMFNSEQYKDMLLSMGAR